MKESAHKTNLELVQHMKGSAHKDGHILSLLIIWDRSQLLVVYAETLKCLILACIITVVMKDHKTVTCLLNLSRPAARNREVSYRNFCEINVPDFKKDLISKWRM